VPGEVGGIRRGLEDVAEDDVVDRGALGSGAVEGGGGRHGT
jgi:hypothetical protein